jgi:alanine dehydrogenase
MRPGAVLVDISIDQGGCFETSRVTTHTNPTYARHGVVHYCVGNMPGGVPHTSTYALTNATLPYALVLARKGLSEALAGDRALARGVNVHEGNVTNQAVAEALGLPFVPLGDLIPGTA